MALLSAFYFSTVHASALTPVTVSGTVLNPNGSGVSGVSVYATEPGTSTVDFGPVTTDASGSYSLDVTVGTYDFHFDPPSGSNLVPTVDSNEIILNTSTINISLAPVTHTVSGVLSDQNGNPLPNVQLVYISSGRLFTDTRTDNAGHYSLTLGADIYTIRLLGSLGANSVTLTTLDDSRQIDLTHSDLQQNLQITLLPLTVKVKDQNGAPIAGATVGGSSYTANAPSLVPDATDMTTSMNLQLPHLTTDADGSVTYLIPEGVVFDQDSGPGSQNDNLWAQLPGGQIVTMAAPLTMSEATTIVITQPSTHTVSGVLTDQYGNPLPEVRVIFISSDRLFTDTLTDSTGHYSLTLNADTYTIRLLGSLGPNSVVLNLLDDSHSIDLTQSDLQQNLQITLLPLTVKVNDQDGNPVAGAVVGGSSDYTPNAPSLASGSTDMTTTMSFEFSQQTTGADGTVTFLVPKGAIFGQEDGPGSTNDNVWARLPNGQTIAMAAPLTVTEATTLILEPGLGVTLSVPTNLAINSPTQEPSLTWDAVSGATGYDIYRDGVDIGSSSTSSFTDSTATEGTHDYYVTATNGSAESDPSGTVSVMVDNTAPTNPTLSWNTNPLLSGTDTILTASTGDVGSGVKEVTYTIDNGTPQQMTYDATSGTWTATFGSSLAVGTYDVVVRATDNAGNTNSGAVDVLAVYTTGNGYVTGHAKILPTASDVLPIDEDTSSNPTRLVIGFTNLTAPTSGSFDVDYSIKNNQNEFTLSSTGITWVLISDSTHASILGQADMTTYVDGVKTVTSNVSVRFDIVLGTNGADDQITMKIYDSGVNPNNGTANYVLSDEVLPNGSNVMVHP